MLCLHNLFIIRVLYYFNAMKCHRELPPWQTDRLFYQRIRILSLIVIDNEYNTA